MFILENVTSSDVLLHFQTFNEEEISTETFPNALHVLNISITTRPQTQDLLNDFDGYGSPLGSVISFNNFNVNTFEDNLSSDNNNDDDDDTIPQIPSANVPDQNNPEKYFNNEIQTIQKVLGRPIFYNDATNHFTNSYYSYYS